MIKRKQRIVAIGFEKVSKFNNNRAVTPPEELRKAFL